MCGMLLHLLSLRFLRQGAAIKMLSATARCVDGGYEDGAGGSLVRQHDAWMGVMKMERGVH